jgi:pimeloyl-ACP methyl ester carboxylesterase
VFSTTSSDGTRIAVDRIGEGPALVLVDGALCHRGFGSSQKIAAELAAEFTVYIYDRRGRCDSGDSDTYAVEREIDDLAAVIDAAGGSACVFGLCSGGDPGARRRSPPASDQPACGLRAAVRR